MIVCAATEGRPVPASLPTKIAAQFAWAPNFWIIEHLFVHPNWLAELVGDRLSDLVDAGHLGLLMGRAALAETIRESESVSRHGKLGRNMPNSVASCRVRLRHATDSALAAGFNSPPRSLAPSSMAPAMRPLP